MSTKELGFFANAREYIEFHYGSMESFLEKLDASEIEELKNNLPQEVLELEEVQEAIFQKFPTEWSEETEERYYKNKYEEILLTFMNSIIQMSF